MVAIRDHILRELVRVRQVVTVTIVLAFIWDAIRLDIVACTAGNVARIWNQIFIAISFVPRSDLANVTYRIRIAILLTWIVYGDTVVAGSR